MKSLGICISVLVLIWVAGPSPAFASFSGTEVYLASVGGGPGQGDSQWYTTIWVHNPTASPALVQFSFLHRNQSNPAPADIFNDTVPPGDTRRYDNAVKTMFGLDSAFGAIKAVSDQRLLVSSRIFNLPAGSEDRDSVGQFFAAVPAEFAIAAGQVTELLGVYQTEPADDSQFRYNYGFVETVGGNATVRVTAYNSDGVSLATQAYTLGPFEPRQYAFKNQFSGVSGINIRLSVELVSGSGRVVAFGSGLANRSNDPSTFEMSFRDDLLAGGQPGGGTITGVTAGMGLTGGGSTGDVTLDIGEGAGISVGANSVAIANGGVTTEKVANNAVTGVKIAADAVSSTKIADGTIATADLADGAVTTKKIENGAVGAVKIEDGAIIRAKIADGAVNGAKLDADSVSSSHIIDGQVHVEDLGFGSVTTAKIEDGTILEADIASGAITTEKIRNLDVTTNDLANGAVNGSKIAVPLTVSGGATTVLELSNSSSGGIPGSTLRAINSTTGGGIAGYLETAGTDATLVVENNGTGNLIKAFGGNGGNEEFHVENNGTIRQYDSSHSNTITLDANSGRGTFRDLRVSGHADATLPIAYAFIEGSNADVRSGTSNVSCTWNAAGERYEITIQGESYYYRDYQTTVNTAGSLARFAVTNSSGGKLVVAIFDLAGNKVKNDFQFVTFKGP